MLATTAENFQAAEARQLQAEERWKRPFFLELEFRPSSPTKQMGMAKGGNYVVGLVSSVVIWRGVAVRKLFGTLDCHHIWMHLFMVFF